MRMTLCGSARFEAEFKEWNKRLTLAGHVVYSLGVYPSDMGKKDWYDGNQKVVLDQVHLAKIDNSDAILVLNVDGYVEESTTREIEHAHATEKTVYVLTWRKVTDAKLRDLLATATIVCNDEHCPDPLQSVCQRCEPPTNGEDE